MNSIPSSSSVVDIWVVGTASLDILHLENQKVYTAGGSGLYTALAATLAGANTQLWAPRPDPLPVVMQPLSDHVMWSGPSIRPEVLPRLEIVHHGEGRATLLDASWGAESQLEPAQLPAGIASSAFVHIAALSTAEKQLAFVQRLLSVRDTRSQPRISVGTYARLVQGELVGVRQLVEHADCFFMNENEAQGVFGRVEHATTQPNRLLFVTLGADGALVITGDMVTHVAGHPAIEIDPTGAGDTFCGVTLAGLTQGLTAVEAAQRAVIVAAETVSSIGPTALLPT